MKKRPILFSGPMVRALLDGTKTQTRRVVKPQPEYRPIEWVGNMLGFKKRHDDGFWLWPNAKDQIIAECPYGQVGDRLWVRETFLKADRRAAGLPPWVYAADYTQANRPKTRWVPSIHMPRAASRITLEIVKVRIERLQDISETDAVAEGSFCWAGEQDTPVRDLQEARLVYRQLWESINGPGSWDANPWVWVVEFKRVEGGAE